MAKTIQDVGLELNYEGLELKALQQWADDNGYDLVPFVHDEFTLACKRNLDVGRCSANLPEPQDIKWKVTWECDMPGDLPCNDEVLAAWGK